MKGLSFFFSILILSFPAAQAVVDGYPSDKVDIVSEHTAVIKNNFCFPVVVDVLGLTLDVPAKSKSELKNKSWGPWHWMPGMRSSISRKEVYYPLKNKTKVDAGPGSVPTHQKHTFYAYDFSIPEKTPVLAMESGMVIRAVSHFKESHTDKNRMDETNTVEIVHADGTVARYSHLYPNSLKVKHCEQVKAGEELALTGNTGYSWGPHLHVDILKPTSGKSFVTLPLSFLTSPP